MQAGESSNRRRESEGLFFLSPGFEDNMPLIGRQWHIFSYFDERIQIEAE